MESRRRGDRSRRCGGRARACGTRWGAARAGPHGAFTTVAKLLGLLGYSLQANGKTREGAASRPRRAVRAHQRGRRAAIAAGQPVISVDTKKKELVGDFKNGGREWRPKGEPELVRVHDFMDKQLGKAIPYGVYDLAANQGWVSVGIDHDTAEFAVNSIRSWWQHLGQQALPRRDPASITADGGGSNGNRAPPVEGRAAEARRRDRPGDRRLPPPARHQQVEQDRAPPLHLHHAQLARQAAALASRRSST